MGYPSSFPSSGPTSRVVVDADYQTITREAQPLPTPVVSGPDLRVVPEPSATVPEPDTRSIVVPLAFGVLALGTVATLATVAIVVAKTR